MCVCGDVWQGGTAQALAYIPSRTRSHPQACVAATTSLLKPNIPLPLDGTFIALRELSKVRRDACQLWCACHAHPPAPHAHLLRALREVRAHLAEDASCAAPERPLAPMPRPLQSIACS